MPGLRSSRHGLVSEELVGVGVFSRENGQFPATGIGRLKVAKVYDRFQADPGGQCGPRRLQEAV